MFGWFFNARDTRENQMQRQEKVDRELKNFGCDYTVMQYLLKQRETNRIRTLEYNNACLTNIKHIAEKQLNETDRELNEIESIVKGNYRCSKLKNMLSK